MKPPVFYGWWIIASVMAAGFLAAGSSQLFMAIMLKPISDEFDWSRSVVAGAITIGTVSSGLAAPFAGLLADRYGPRVIMPVAAVLVGLAFLSLAYLESVWQFYVSFLVARAVGGTALGGVVGMTAAANWFRRRRGRALGFVSLAVPLGGFAFALGGQLIIDLSGWRTVFLVLAGLVFAYAVPAFLVLRRRPEDLGLMPDGEVEVSLPAGPTSSRPPMGWRLTEALRTRSLWLLAIGLHLGALGGGGVSFHQVAYFTDVGIATTAAAVALSVYAVTGALSSGVWGFLIERYSERLMVIFAMGGSALAIAFLLFVRTPEQAYIFAAMFGLTARGDNSLVMNIVANYYGRESYGSISGIITPFQMLGLGAGPFVASACYDLTGSYEIVFIFYIGSYLVAATLMGLARKPERRPVAAPVEAGI